MATIAAVIRWADNTADLKRNLQEGLNQIEATRASAEKLVAVFRGDNLVQAAHRNVAAIQEIGGAAMLSASQAKRSLDIITDAIAALERQQKPVPEAMRAMRDELEKVAAVAPKMEPLSQRITGIVAAAAAAREAIRGLVTVVGEWIQASSQQEDALVRLDTALRAQGTFTPQLAQQYRDLAEQFQQTTVFSDELVMEMQALLVQVGDVMPDQMNAALKAATDLAAGLRIDLQTATMLVGKAFAGETGTLKRYGIVIDEVELKTRGAAAVIDAIAAKMGGQASAQAQTFSGQMQRLGNAINETQESLGAFLARGLQPVIDGFMSLPTPVQQGIVGFGLLVAAAGALATAVTGVAAAVALALPLLGMTPATAGATAIAGLTSAASAALPVLGALAAAILAIWAAFKLGDSENFKNNLATLVLSSNTGYAGAVRWALGLDQMSEAEARAAIQATAAAQSHRELSNVLNGLKPMASHETNDGSTITGAFTVAQLERAAEASRRAAEAAKKAAEEQARWNEKVREFSGPAKGFETDLAMMHFRMGQFSDMTLEADQRALGLIGTLEQFKATQLPEIPSRILPGPISQGMGTEPTPLPATTFDASISAAERLDLVLGELNKSFVDLAQISDGAMGNVARAVGTVIASMEVAKQSTNALKDGLTNINSGDKVTGFAQLAAGALSAAAAFDAATSSTSKLANALGGAATGAQIGSMFGPIGTAIGAVTGALAGLFRTASEESTRVSPLRDEFFRLQGGLETLNPLVLTLTGNLELVQAVFEADTVEEYNAAIKELTDLIDLQKTAFADLEAAAKRYGFTIEELGPAMQRQELDKQAQQLFKDWQLLNSAGIETTTVATRMAESINNYVHNALKMGIEVPEAMRPMLQQMADLGLLTDAAGNKITDLESSGISFTMSMSEGFRALIDEVKKLTELIARSLGIELPAAVQAGTEAINQIPGAAQDAADGVVKEVDVMEARMDGFWDRIRTTGTDAFNYLPQASEDAAVAIISDFGDVAFNADAFWERIRTSADGAMEAVVESTEEATSDILTQIDIQRQKYDATWGRIITGADGAMDAVVDSVEQATDNIQDSLDSIDPPDLDIDVGWDIDPFRLPKNIPSEIEIDVGYNYGSMGGLVTAQGIQHFASGGPVLPVIPHGIDTVPAMLAVGEGVVNRAGMGVLGEDGLASLNSGAFPSRGGGGQTIIHFNPSIQVNGSLIHQDDLRDVVGQAYSQALEKGGRTREVFDITVKQAVKGRRL